MDRQLMRALFLLLALALGGPAADAQMIQAIVAGGHFTGLTDVETTIVHCWAVAACGSTQANAAKTAVDLCKATGCSAANSCTGVKVLSSGALDVSTGLYCNSASQTVTTFCSTNCVAGGSVRLSKLYDQIGSANATAASYAVSMDFVLSGVNSSPTAGCVSSRSVTLPATITSVATPNGLGATFEQTANFASSGNLFTASGGGGSFFSNSSANTLAAVNFGSSVNFSLTGITNGSGTSDFSHFHRAILAQSSSGSGPSQMYVDGAVPTGGTPQSSGGGNGTGTTFTICGASPNFGDFYITSVWIDNTQPSTTIQANVTSLSTVPLP